MDLRVALDARYAVTPDGSVWSQAVMARSFWERYLDVFDTVSIVARASRVEVAPPGWPLVNGGKGIHLHPVPDFLGPWQCLKQYPRSRAAVRSAASTRGAVILRVGSQVANMLESALTEKGHPYALEVVGDPYDVFAPGVLDHPLRPFFRWHFSRRLRWQCRHAVGVAYVTKHTLQERYPTSLNGVSISDVDLPHESLRGTPFSASYSSIELARQESELARCARRAKREGSYCIVTVGSLAQFYKGTDVLIEALARCVRDGMDLTAVIVGDGKYRPGLMAQAERAGIAARIQFPGQVLAGEPVRRILDGADLFVLPSRTEGLPRALIEAMARGLPCIASEVGGIPELLSQSELVPPGDAGALASSIKQLLRDPSRMERIAHRNLEISRDYQAAILNERRRKFYERVRDATQTWYSRQRT